ncbi:hypothetical protein PV08_07194 [Exophiala spinifera]|uniref:Roadblock/LAMTOR2 domain-containing protein n=1 Tax=Exophiala spinifera TaxID=91928 RepID=A0A0D1YHL3_9EURO|nr:uncharacterized protein PV08_07194 [Exophiala spinifera]KIW14411.1 hypothetical protein PV08_07194 [Exophiala spinifera]
MGQVCLLDSGRLSALLQDALSWGGHVSSLMVSALNGSILAYAYRNATPSIKDIRTQSTTMTAAYTVASEDVLVFEAQNMGALSVVTPIADHILLAVTGPEPKKQKTASPEAVDEEQEHTTNGDIVEEQDQAHSEAETEHEHEQVRTDLEAISQELATLLREELAKLRWPEDI